jgi:hypothetical protein
MIAGRIRRMNPVTMKNKRSRTVRCGWYFFRFERSIAA